MSIARVAVLFGLGLPLLGSCTSGPATDSAAELVYMNGRIYTVDSERPWAEAVAIRDGKFLVVGSNVDVEGVTGEGTEVVDLRGAFVMPGIVDMHAHPFSGVDLGTGSARLDEPGDPEAILAAVGRYIADNPERDVILGGNWNIGGIFENDSPDKKWLDEIAPDVPVFLLSQSGHSGWANSRALELAGIDESFENTRACIFDRYPGTNEPSGTVRESGMVLIMNALHYLPAEEFAPFFEEEIERYSKYGITAIQPAEGSPSWYQGAAQLEREGRLDVRLFPAGDWLTSQLRVLDVEETKAFIADWRTYETELIKPHYVKIFADGAADTHTLLMKEPYADDPGNHGSMYLPVEEYRAAILEFFSQGVSVHVHAMGDATIANVVDIFEAAQAAYPESEGTLHLAHAVSFDQVDIDRLAALTSASVDFSPMLAVPHPQMELFLETPLGKERHQEIYPVRSAIEAGIPVGFGSDFPSSLVPDPNAFWYMEGWVTRRVPGEPDLGTLNAAQAISVEQAIHGFTLGGAMALGSDYSERFGSIEAGKSADMIVLDRNLLEILESELHEVEVDQTLFRGELVFDRARAIAELEVVRFEIVNPELRGAVDAAALNLLVETELGGGGHSCLIHDIAVDPGAASAPDEVNAAFASLSEQGYRFARPARAISWRDGSTYWIQWTLKEDVAVLWAFDPATRGPVEVLQVHE